MLPIRPGPYRPVFPGVDAFIGNPLARATRLAPPFSVKGTLIDRRRGRSPSADRHIEGRRPTLRLAMRPLTAVDGRLWLVREESAVGVP